MLLTVNRPFKTCDLIKWNDRPGICEGVNLQEAEESRGVDHTFNSKLLYYLIREIKHVTIWTCNTHPHIHTNTHAPPPHAHTLTTPPHMCLKRGLWMYKNHDFLLLFYLWFIIDSILILSFSLSLSLSLNFVSASACSLIALWIIVLLFFHSFSLSSSSSLLNFYFFFFYYFFPIVLQSFGLNLPFPF